MQESFYEQREVKRRSQSQEGAVTAEFAVMIPAFLFLLSIIFFIGFLLTQQLQLNDNAHMAARALSRGEDEALVRSKIMQTFGESSRLKVQEGYVSLKLRVNTSLFFWLHPELEAQSPYDLDFRENYVKNR